MRTSLLILSCNLLLTEVHLQTQECLSRSYGHGSTVCVCNSDYCDTIPRPTKVEPPQYLIYTSNKAGLRFKQEIGEFASSSSTRNQILINREKKYQKIIGFGSSFSDATGININSVDDNLQDKLLRSYFADDGIEYSLCRVPMGSTDFSTHAYTYDDGEVDLELKNFTLAAEDLEYKIPHLKKAIELSDNNVNLLASPWIAPKWMKTNGQYGGFGFLKKDMYQVWADYFVKFLDKYLEEGVPIWGVTTGNEPNTVYVFFLGINVVGWLPWNLDTWISNNLGPAIKNSNHPNTKIITHDDQRLFLPWLMDLTIRSNETKKYVHGFGVHWYLNNVVSPSVLTDTHNHFPDKIILATEACNGVQLFVGPVVLGSWERGENYSNDIMENLQNWVSGWIDWNMVLNLAGGPSYIHNQVDAAIIVNATAGEFYKQPMFYHLGHFSKFLPKDSVRIDTKHSSCCNVMVVAFEKPDNGTVVVILNKSKKSVSISLTDDTKGTAKLTLTEKSITTVLYW